MDTIFEHDVTFLSKTFDTNTNEWSNQRVTKKVKFYELNQVDRRQHKLHFMIISLFDSTSESEELRLSTDKLYDITVKFIKTLLIKDDSMQEIEEQELLNDSSALLSLGFWLLENKITPFFSVFNMK